MTKDYYKTLDVEKGASKEQIKKAYKKLAKKYHPDINKAEDAEAKFKEINEAVSVLGDDSKKQQYDQFGSDYFKQAGGGSGFSNFSQGFGGFSDFGDIFDQFFGGQGRRQSRRRVYKGNDLLAQVEITLEQAAFGTKKTINLNKQEKCDACNGEGGTGIKVCSTCHGTGQVTSVRRTPFGMFQTTGSCSECGGEGKTIENMCSVCNGRGTVKKKKTLEIKIPAGIENGSRLRLQGEGDAAPKDGIPGDLYLEVYVKEHKYFKRRDYDIILEVPITYTQAVLGDKIEVPTLHGKTLLKIPSGTQPGTIFKMRDKGIQHLHGHFYGDQLVKIIVEVPKKFSGKYKKLIKELSSIEDKPQQSFLKKILGK
jgi:molecular chaperone DnaJ